MFSYGVYMSPCVMSVNMQSLNFRQEFVDKNGVGVRAGGSVT